MTTDVSSLPGIGTTSHTVGPLVDAQAQLASAVATLDYEPGLHALLASPRREMTVSIPLRRDDGSVEVLTGHRVQHNVSRGPAKDIPAPDIGTDEQTMAWMMDTFSVSSGYTVPGVVTGKPVSLGGSLGRASATSAGVVHIALAALEHVGITAARATAAVQGFGKVGADAALFLTEAGVKVVSVSDQYGAVHRADGLDIRALQEHVAVIGSVVGFPGAETIPGEQLLTLEVDLLLPAAVEGVLTGANAHEVRARVVVEGANGPTTAEADRVLAEAGVLVVPDILANAGGVVVSYFEWVQSNQAYWWSRQEVDHRLEHRMLSAWHHLLDVASARGLTLREAATVTAVERVADAHRTRGLYP